MAGQTRYVEVAMRVGLLAPSCDVAEVPADQGQAAVEFDEGRHVGVGGAADR